MARNFAHKYKTLAWDVSAGATLDLNEANLGWTIRKRAHIVGVYGAGVVAAHVFKLQIALGQTGSPIFYDVDSATGEDAIAYIFRTLERLDAVRPFRMRLVYVQGAGGDAGVVTVEVIGKKIPSTQRDS